MLYGDRYGSINTMISECTEFSWKEYKNRHDWAGKVIDWELHKKYKFDHTNKWYMHNPVPDLENEMHNILGDFEIQTDHLISVRQPDLVITNKKRKWEHAE